MSRTQPSADNGAAQPSGSANSGLLPQRWILVVDDDASVREMLGRVLFAEGYGAWLAADGIEALTIAGVAQVDLVLLDLNLPKKSGWDTFERLTAANPLAGDHHHGPFGPARDRYGLGRGGLAGKTPRFPHAAPYDRRGAF